MLVLAALLAAALATHCPALGEQSVLVAPEGTAPVPQRAPAVRGRTLVPLHSTVIVGGGRTRHPRSRPSRRGPTHPRGLGS